MVTIFFITIARNKCNFFALQCKKNYGVQEIYLTFVEKNVFHKQKYSDKCFFYLNLVKSCLVTHLDTFRQSPKTTNIVSWSMSSKCVLPIKSRTNLMCLSALSLTTAN